MTFDIPLRITGWDEKQIVEYSYSNLLPMLQEWYDYDEKSGQSVSISEFQHQFVTAK